MRRPGRPRVNVGRSIGVAEHHACTGLTRLNVTRLVAVACIGALGFLPAVPAHAATSAEQIQATSKAINAAAQRWFAAQADATRIDANIADVEQQIEVAQARMACTRKIATARAVVLYKNADIGITSMLGDNALDSARRAHLVERRERGRQRRDRRAHGRGRRSQLASSRARSRARRATQGLVVGIRPSARRSMPRWRACAAWRAVKPNAR